MRPHHDPRSGPRRNLCLIVIIVRRGSVAAPAMIAMIDPGLGEPHCPRRGRDDPAPIAILNHLYMRVSASGGLGAQPPRENLFPLHKSDRIAIRCGAGSPSL